MVLSPKTFSHYKKKKCRLVMLDASVYIKKRLQNLIGVYRDSAL